MEGVIPIEDPPYRRRDPHRGATLWKERLPEEPPYGRRDSHKGATFWQGETSRKESPNEEGDSEGGRLAKPQRCVRQ